MAFTFQTGANSHFLFRMKNTSGCSHVGFFAAFTMCLLKKAKKVALSIFVLCICCSLNWKDRNGACYFEDVSPGIPARAGAVPGHHHLARVAIPEPCLGVRWTWSEIWAMKRLCLTEEMEVVKQGPCCLSAEGAADDHSQSICMDNPIFTGWQTLPLDMCWAVVKGSD